MPRAPINLLAVSGILDSLHDLGQPSLVVLLVANEVDAVKGGKELHSGSIEEFQ